MKKASDEKLPEYNFSDKKGIRGKYAKAYRSGHSVKVYSGDKLVSDEYFAAIESDEREYFPDSKSINKMLRKLIALAPRNDEPVQKRR